jgi:hypothetical protein
LFGFSDVYFVYRMNIFAQYFCSFPAVSGYFQSVCHCTAANFEWDDGQQRDGNVYCVKSSICTDKNAREGLCKLTVNPFADGCMLISTNSFKGYFDEAEQQRVRASVSYALTVPSVADIGTALFSDPSSASASQSRSRSTSQDAAAEQLLWKAVETIAHYLGVFFSYCPMYIVNCLLGYALVSNARELADEAWMQLVVQCIYGLFLAVLVIAYVLYWYGSSLLLYCFILYCADSPCASLSYSSLLQDEQAHDGSLRGAHGGDGAHPAHLLRGLHDARQPAADEVPALLHRSLLVTKKLHLPALLDVHC